MNKDFDSIKSKYRVVELTDTFNSFYIQRKGMFGWSYDVKNDRYDEFPWWFHLVAFLMSGSALVTIASIVSLFFVIGYWKFLLIFSLITIFLFLLLAFLCEKEKDFSYNFSNLNDAERKIDSLVRTEILNAEKKIKTKKYHYFFTSKQLRKQKLDKLNNV